MHLFSVIGFHLVQAPWHPEKKSEEAGGSSNPDENVVSDTTPHVMDAIKSWRQIFENLEYQIRNCPDNIGNENKLRDIAKSELHKIVTRPRLMPYNDMVC
jgi:hypothetical protein